MVELLLALGADPTITDTEHDSPPAGWATHSGHADLAASLEQEASTRGAAGR